jgi:large subunit ribosomal protein L47
MLAVFRTTARASALAKHTPTVARAYATVEDGTPASGVPSVASEAAVAEALATPAPATARRVPGAPGAQRPHLDVAVKPDHGLYAFFRRVAPADGGAARLETLEPGIPSATDSGRAWTAPELRRKDLRDLHTLWYVVLRERNLLASQREEARRMGIANTNALAVPVKTAHVRLPPLRSPRQS